MAATRARAAAVPAKRRGSEAFSSADISGTSSANWKTIPMRVNRMRVRCFSGNA